MHLEGEPIREIITTDPGIDDAVALLVAWSALKNPASVAVIGNGTIERTFGNLMVLGNFRKEYGRSKSTSTPVIFAGTDISSTGEHFQLEVKYGDSLDFIHGAGAMQGFGLEVTKIDDHDKSGVLYQRMVKDEHTKVDLFSFGAVTEILTILQNPGMRKKTKSVTLMGGSLHEPGNVEPHLEANFRHDPQALVQIIKLAAESEIKLTIVPLDVSQNRGLELTPKRMKKLVRHLRGRGSPKIADFIYSLAGSDSTYFKFYTDTADRYQQKSPYRKRKIKGPFIHDLTALMVKLHPELFIIKRRRIKVITSGSEAGAIGVAQDHMEPDGNARVALDLLDRKVADLYWKYVEDYLAKGYK